MESSKKQKIGAASTVLVLALGAAFSVPSKAADMDPGLFGSVTVQRFAEDAARALKARDHAKAMNLYRKCIGLDSNEKLFYFGLYKSAAGAGLWDQAAFALEQIVEKDPSAKAKMNYEFGEAMYHLNRYDEAVPMLKAALAATGDNYIDNQVKSLFIKSVPPVIKDSGSSVASIGPAPTMAPIVHEKPPERTEKMDQLNVRPDTSDTALNYQNAFKSESITICEYVGYDKRDDISFYNPPTARFKVVKRLHGPPTPSILPLRYEFHDKTESVGQKGALEKKLETGKMPKGWKFGPDKMPTKGSKWIVFIPNFVARTDGSYDTYQGSYGRQEATEDNLNQIYRIIEEHKGQQ